MTFRKVVKRELIKTVYLETMECGHTHSTERPEPLNHIPCLTCDADRENAKRLTGRKDG